MQLLVQAEAATKNYEDAIKHIDQALSHPRIGGREHLVPRWLYFKSCVEFLKGDVNESFKTLNKDSYIIRQVDEWNVQFRLLEMMQLAEFQDEEWLEFKIDSTRKFLTRHKELATPRVKAAVDILSNLLRRDLDFTALSEKNLELLKVCFEEDNGYEWHPHRF